MTTACKGDGMLKMNKLPQNQYKRLFHLVEILTLDLSRLLVVFHKIKELLTILFFFKQTRVHNCCSVFQFGYSVSKCPSLPDL
jgi:hypothetical protein